MKLLLTPAEKNFQQSVRDFLQRELTDDIRRATELTPAVFVEKDIALAWQAKLYKQGWLAPRWPAEYGGADWSAMQRYIFDLEAALAGAPGMIPMGLGMVAPVIIKYGSDEQKAEYLPKILSGEHYWCQGYSEPQSGSDLASLQCRAVRDGDHYIVNGTKIWTTHAHFATHIFCLVRTDSTVKAQQGISFLLIDMQTPGISVTPIHSFAGDQDVIQVFFDNVKVPVANRVGGEGQGWTCAKYLLEHERGGSFGSPALLRDLARLKVRLDSADATLQRRLAELEMDTYCLQQYEISVARASGHGDPASASIIKTLYTEIQQHITELALDAVGPFAAILDKRRPLYTHAPVHELPVPATVTPAYLNFRAASIYGGSNEIQRTVIARSILGAPCDTPLQFNDEQKLLSESAADFADNFYTPALRGHSERDETGFNSACWEKMTELGWQYLGVPARFDGLGGSAADWLALAYGLGGGLLIEPLFSAWALPAALFERAEEPIARRGFERIASGTFRYAAALREHPSLRDNATVLSGADTALLLSGSKTLVQHAASAHSLLVACRYRGETALVEVPREAPGVRVQSYRLLDDSSAADVWFDRVNLPADALIAYGIEAERALADMEWLAMALACADSLRQMQLMLRATLDYLNTRRQFGAPLATFQALQHRVADMQLHKEMATAALQYLLDHCTAENGERAAAVVFAKAQIDKAARYVGQQAIQLHGGIGITAELKVGAQFKRATLNARLYGERAACIERYLALTATGQ